MTAATQKQKFATATTSDANYLTEKVRPDLTPEDVQQLRLMAQSFMSDDWRADQSCRVINGSDFMVAEMAHQTDAVALAAFTPWRLHQLLDLAEQALGMEPTLR